MKFNQLRFLATGVIVFSSFFNVVLASSVLEEREVVVYKRGFAEIREVRSLSLERGENEIVLEGLSPELLQSTISLEVLNNRHVETVDVSYNGDSFSLDGYWESKVGQAITLALSDTAEVSGTLVDIANSYLLIRDEASDSIRFVEIGDVLVPESIDPSLYTFTGPKIIWRCRSQRAVDIRVSLMYRTNNITWTAAYRVNINDDKANVRGSFVVSNTTGLDLQFDRIILAAGTIHLAGDKRRVDRDNPLPGARVGEQTSQFSEIRRFVVNEDGILANNYTALIPMFFEENIEIDRYYIYDAAIFDDRITSHLGFSMEHPMPSGDVGIYEDRGSESLFIGEDRIDDTPNGSPVDLTIAQSFDLTAERVRIAESTRDDGGTEQVFRVVLGNSGQREVDVRVLERLFGNWDVEYARAGSQQIRWAQEDARTAAFYVTVRPAATLELEYKIIYRR